MTQLQSLNDSGKNPLTTVNSATVAAAEEEEDQRLYQTLHPDKTFNNS